MKLRHLLSAVALFPMLAWSQVAVTPLRQFSFHKEASVGHDARLAFDREYAYVSSPDGEVFRTPHLRGDSPLKEIYEGRFISNLVAYPDALYVLVQTVDVPEGQPLEHSVVQSTNHGASFHPVDKGLKECHSGYCQYIWPDELIRKGNLLFVNAGAGRNLLVSPNWGDDWRVLSGFLGAGNCTLSTFAISRSTVLQGGECPLDRAYIDRGTLAPDKLHWLPGEDLKPVQSPDLENRNVTAIKFQPGSEVVLAGAEGAVLRSVDEGHSFYYAFKITSGPHYPYIHHILFPSRSPSTPLIAGFDKSTGRPYLAISHDNGETWTDVSHLLPGFSHDAAVSALTEDSHGSIIAAVTDFTDKNVILVKIRICE